MIFPPLLKKGRWAGFAHSVSDTLTFDTFYQKHRLYSCGTKPQHSGNHWCLQLHDDISMRTPMSS